MKQITAHELDAMSEQAGKLPRLRTHHMLHPQLSDPVQRLAVAMEPGTYIRPHRHPQTWELLIPLRGRFVVLQFDHQGVVTQRTLLGATTKVLEIPALAWHAVLSVDPGGVIFEVKQGPYQPLKPDDCLLWAPEEGGEGMEALMRWYATANVGDQYTR